MKLRPLVFTLHRYVGVMVGLLLVLMGLTGSLLVFDSEIDRSLNRALLRVTPQDERVSLETLLATVRERYPSEKLEAIKIPQKPDEVYEFYMKLSSADQYKVAYVNPYSGTLLGSRLLRHSLMGFLLELHVYLLAGEIGMTIVGISGLLLLLLSITGLILWPGWRRLIPGLTIRWRSPWKLLNYDLHKVGGILSVVFLIIIASTGAVMGLWTQSEQALYWLTHTPKLAESIDIKAPHGSPLSLDELLRKANNALPGAKTMSIELPLTPQVALKVRKKFPQEGNPYGWSLVYLDHYSGEVLRVDNALKAPLAARIMHSLLPFHTGLFGGLKMRLLYVFIGLAPTVLFITGFTIWWSRNIRSME